MSWDPCEVLNVTLRAVEPLPHFEYHIEALSKLMQQLYRLNRPGKFSSHVLNGRNTGGRYRVCRSLLGVKVGFATGLIP